MERGALSRRRLAIGAGAAGLLAVLWLLSGIRLLDPAREFGVLDGSWPGLPKSVSGVRVVLAPPGLRRVSVFPLEATSLPLPGATEAMLPSEDGSPFGLKGSVRMRAIPERARELARGSHGGGLPGILLSAVREAASDLKDLRPAERIVPTRLSDFEARLAGALTARGVAVESLELTGFDVLKSATRGGAVPKDARLLVVGLDGADWEVVDPLMAAGRMPNLARLVARGVRAKLLTITPTLSPVVWTSIATGVEPARHGIFDFLTGPEGGPREPVTSRARKAPALWELLSTAGVPVSVTGWWATWPADHVTGTMVTDRVSYQLFGYASDERSAEGKTWPPELYDTIRPLIVSPDKIPWSEVASYLDGPRTTREQFDPEERELLDEFRTLLASSHTYLDAALTQRRLSPARFEAVYFEGTDTVGHLFMPYHPPQAPGIDAARFASFHDVVDRYYETADGMLGKLLEGRDDWTVLVLSDHGFASDATRPRTTDSRIGHGAAADWHRRFGILVVSGPGVRRGTRLDEASVLDIAPTVLALFGQPVPRSWPGRVLGGAFEPALLASRPVRFRDDDPVRTGAAPEAGEAVGGDEAHELREKLQALGYVGADTATPMTTKNNRGVSLLASGRFAEAAAEFRRALKDAPEQATLWVNLGVALRFDGKQGEARALFVRALERPEAFRPASQQLAQLDMDAGDLAGAERVLHDALDREPGAPELRNALGLVLERKGDTPGARKEYEQARRLDPNFAEPRNNLGNMDKRAGRLDDAERSYREAIEVDPYFMGAYNNLALLFQERGDAPGAIELYGRALSKSPQNAVVMNNLASLYFATGDNAKAKAFWRRASQTSPTYPSPWNNLAGLALAENDLDEAARCLDRALSLDPGYGDARLNRSLLMRRRGDLDGARAELVKAAADERSALPARVQLGRLELEQGRPRPAVVVLEQARHLAGERTEILNPLGEAYGRLGDKARALEAWRASLRLDPTQARLAAAVQQLEGSK